MSYYLVTEFRLPATMASSYVGELTQVFASWESAWETRNLPLDAFEKAVKETMEREMDCAVHTYRYVRHADR